MDAVHTDATFYGSLVSVGHIDFYPGSGGRYGRDQPQFDFVSNLMAGSHSEAMDLYTITVNTTCLAWKVCENISTGECQHLDQSHRPRLGYHLEAGHAPNGQYSVVVTRHQPYCRSVIAMS